MMREKTPTDESRVFLRDLQEDLLDSLKHGIMDVMGQEMNRPLAERERLQAVVLYPVARVG